MTLGPFDFNDFTDALGDKRVHEMLMHLTEEYGLVIMSPDALMQSLSDTYLEQIIVAASLVDLLARTRKDPRNHCDQREHEAPDHRQDKLDNERNAGGFDDWDRIGKHR